MTPPPRTRIARSSRLVPPPPPPPQAASPLPADAIVPKKVDAEKCQLDILDTAGQVRSLCAPLLCARLLTAVIARRRSTCVTTTTGLERAF